MYTRKTSSLLTLACLLCAAQALAAADPAPANLTAAQIVDRHVAARGGLAAWRQLQTLTVAGQVDAGTGDSLARSDRLAKLGVGVSARRPRPEASAAGEKSSASQQVQLPFRMEMKKPRKSRLEIDFAGRTAVQVYDGKNGWKVRPYLGRNDVEPFTAEEARSEAGLPEIEGPLVDYAAKGTKVELAGTESVEGRPAYKLKLTMRGGEVQHIWIDKQSFLDVKVEGVPHRVDGHLRSVWMYQRDFRPVQGLVIPFVCETAVDGNPRTHKMIVQSVAVNRPLEDARFAKPTVLVAGAPGGAAPPPGSQATAGRK